jgi:hypothetical protein
MSVMVDNLGTPLAELVNRLADKEFLQALVDKASIRLVP